MKSKTLARLLATLIVALPFTVLAQAKNYGPGVTDTSIRIGQTIPYSGPASAYRVVGDAEVAYFKAVNERGGINGRKVELISLDDAYSPPRALEQTRKLVEQEKVLLIFGSVGTAPNSAIAKYLNDRKVPHLLIPAAVAKFNDPKNLPWTTTLYPSYRMEGRAFARYVLKTRPNAKIGVLSQNDDAGKDYVAGFREGLGAKADALIVRQATYESGDVTVNSQILEMKAAGVDTFFNMSTPKFAAQAIRKAAETGWKPLHLLVSISSSSKSVLIPAGVENSQGIVSAAIMKVPEDDAWRDDKEVQAYLAFVKSAMPGTSPSDFNVMLGYVSATMLHRLFAAAGNDLSRENLLKLATNIQPTSLPLFLPGLTVQTSPTNYDPFRDVRMQRFEGEKWVLFE